MIIPTRGASTGVGHKFARSNGSLASFFCAGLFVFAAVFDVLVHYRTLYHNGVYLAGGGVAVLLSQKKEGRVFGTASGAMLAEFAPNSFQNHGLAVSADGRFIAVPSFTAEVKVRGWLIIPARVWLGNARSGSSSSGAWQCQHAWQCQQQVLGCTTTSTSQSVGGRWLCLEQRVGSL